MATAPKSKTFTVDAIALVAITAETQCAAVELMEDNQAGTSDYVIRIPDQTDDAVTRPAGSRTLIEAKRRGQFLAGDIVGYTKTVSGSWTMCQLEY